MPAAAPTAPPTRPALDPESRFLLPSLSWAGYESLLAEVGGHLRINYLEGMAELMSPGPIHEQFGYVLGRMVSDLIVELDIPAKGQRSTTFRRRDLERGLEPDECFYLESLALLRGRDIEAIDPLPPPDLVIEVEVTSPLVNKLAIYAGLGVPEIWRHDGGGLTILLLGPDGRYSPSARSLAFPFLPMDGFRAPLAAYDPDAETAWMRAYRGWVRDVVAPLHQPGPRPPLGA